MNAGTHVGAFRTHLPSLISHWPFPLGGQRIFEFLEAFRTRSPTPGARSERQNTQATAGGLPAVTWVRVEDDDLEINDHLARIGALEQPNKGLWRLVYAVVNRFLGDDLPTGDPAFHVTAKLICKMIEVVHNKPT